ALQYVDARGRVYAGAEAAVRAVGLRPLGKLAYVYFVPGLRQLADAIYKVVARNRYKLAGTTCEDGTCALHANLSSRSSPAEPSGTRGRRRRRRTRRAPPADPSGGTDWSRAPRRARAARSTRRARRRRARSGRAAGRCRARW